MAVNLPVFPWIFFPGIFFKKINSASQLDEIHYQRRQKLSLKLVIGELFLVQMLLEKQKK